MLISAQLIAVKGISMFLKSNNKTSLVKVKKGDARQAI